MINSPWRADDDADNQSGDNRGDSAHTSISLTVPPASLNFCNQAVSLMLRLWPQPAPGSEAQILLQRSIAWRISPRSIAVSATLLNLLQCHSVLTFSERSLSGQAACGRHPTSRKEAGSVRPVDLSFGLAWQFARVIGVISDSSPPTMTS